MPADLLTTVSAAEHVVEFSRNVAKNGGVITWDTPTERGGGFSQAFLTQLAAVGKALASP